MSSKWCCVEARPFEGGYWYDYVDLPGIPDDIPLRPRHARQAVRLLGVALGVGEVRVWSWDLYGYAMYPESERKVERPFTWPHEEV